MIKLGDKVKIKTTGSYGIVRMLEGYPAYKAYVDVIPGADSGYVYMTVVVPAEDQYVPGTPTGPEVLALNPYPIEELERV